ncbi:gliding motility-associated C-terminal domain-containing protein [Phaeodactylibacter xiamenensis]|uniref:T9SS type B sorting domain-containing protein n=1 Tax=Phaeodactylibacter xiamenensis TaxID=1524460 RepID=UPI003BA95ECF
MTRRLHALLVWGVLLISFSAPLQSKAADGPAPPEKPSSTFRGTEELPPILIPPNDTIVDGICNIPVADTLLLFNPMDLNDSIFILPVDSTASNGTILPGTPLLNAISVCGGPDTLYRIWRGTFADMTEAEAVQRIIITEDTEPPISNFTINLDTVITCELGEPTFDSWRQSRLFAVNSNLEDCTGILSVNTNMPPSSYVPGPCDTLEVTFTIEDFCGNIRNYEASFTTIDTIAPVLQNVPDTIQVSCDTIQQYLMNNPPSMVTAMDNCRDNLTVGFQQDTIPGPQACPEHDLDIRRSWFVTDSCGNFTSAVQVIRVRDFSAPDFTRPPDITISCDADPLDLSITGTVTDTVDACGGPITVTFSDETAPGNCDNSYFIERQWVVEDVCGISSSVNQLITVRDTIAPSFLVPADTTVNCGDEDDFSITGEPTMQADNCSGLNELTTELLSETFIAGSCENDYVLERVWRVTDECGNDSIQVQQVTVIDTIAPVFLSAPSDLTVTCMAGTDIETLYSNWLESYGGAQAGDACTPVDSLTWNTFEAGTNQTVSSTPNIICPSGSDTLLMQVVDFVVDDGCGNSTLEQATFIVIDNTAPTFVECPEDEVIGTNFGQCSANYTLEVPFIQEECASSSSVVNLFDNATITSNASPGQEASVPVNPIVLSFPVSQPLPINAQAGGQLSLQLQNVDAEGTTEYFNVIGEDGTPIGRTGRAMVQCGNADTLLSVPKPLLDLWAVDGVIEIRLEPNIPTTQPGSFAINALCNPAGTVQANLIFPIAELNDLRYEYRTNNNPRVLVDPIAPAMVTLPIGENTITYYISDCAGNIDSCVQQVVVEDQEPPQLTCPSDIAQPLEPGTCSAEVTLPLPDNITDNCGLESPYSQTMPGDTASAWLTYTFDPNLNDYIANSKTYTFNGVAANAFDNVNLLIDLQGDFSSSGAFFHIIGDNGDTIDVTPQGIASCANPGQYVVSIPAADFNAWASDGSVTFTLQPSFIPVPPGGPGDGINPCDAMAVDGDGETDSLSYAFVSLVYQTVTPFYYAEGATEIPYTQMTVPALSPTHEFNVGETTVYYIAQDEVGNPDTCSFIVDVLDNEPPVALCNPTVVEINPSGIEPDTVSVEEFDAGSFDNCSIDTMFLSPNTFTCDEAGTTVMATLTVVDVVGNISTCTRPIRIEAEAPMPTYSSGICGGDTLNLFANPPAAEGGVVYTYVWRGPDGNIISTQQNPVIPNVDEDDSGAYVVTIEGLSGCTAEGVVNVAVSGLPLTPVLQTNAQQCGDDPVELSSSVVLSNATYYWYEGQFPNGTLITTTNQGSLTLPAYNPQQPETRFYYLIIEANGCQSEPSVAAPVLLTPRPVASVNAAVITECEGGSASLGTPVAGTGITYQWTGPDGFFSTDQNPEAINPLEEENAGVYSLTVFRNGCPSEPALSIINVIPKPGPYQIAVLTNPFCEGEKITLQAEPSGAASYIWTGPDLNQITTTTNTLILDNANETHNGNWTVRGVQFSCVSDVSPPASVVVNERPNAMAATSISPEDPLCERSVLQLFGTPNLSAASYTWNGPNGYFSVVQNPTINQVGPLRSGTYTLTVTTEQGCSDTASVSVEVIEAIDIIGVSNSAPECLYGATDVTLQATVFPVNDGTYDFLWTGPGYNSSDEVAVIENVTEALNGGSYSLVVFTEEGCPSLPVSTTLQVKDAPPRAPTPTNPSATYSFCEGEELTLTTPMVTNATYIWNTPSGPVNTGPDNSITISNLTTNDAGSYQVSLIEDGCPSVPSPVRTIQVNANPTVEASSNSPVCGGAQLQLFANGPAGSTYTWQTPMGTTPSGPNIIIPSANPDLHTGAFVVTAQRDGCQSEPDTVTVVINETLPAPANLISNGPICVDEPGATLTVSIPNGQSGGGIQYLWYNAGVPLDTTVTPNLLITDFSGFEGSLTLEAEVQTGDCISDPSPSLLVALDTIPDEMAMVGQDTFTCAGADLLVSATPVSQSIGTWLELNANGGALVIESPGSATTNVSGFEEEGIRQLVWVLSNGGCKSFSSDTLQIQVNVPEPAEAGMDTLLCPGDPIFLNAANPQAGEGNWSQSAVQADFNVEIDNPEDPGTGISGPGLLPGNTYAFTWTVVSECGMDSTGVLITLADNNPFAGFDVIVCEENGVAMLAAGEPADGSSGRWSSPDEQLVFSNRNNTDTEVANLTVGDNLAIWTLDGGLCGDSSRDTLIIDYQLPPVVQNDDRTIEFAVETIVDVLANDAVPEGSTLEVIMEPFNGRARVTADNRIAYTPDPDFAGTDELVYQVCREGCACADAVLRLTVGEGVDCEPPNIFTPNGDGVNEAFIIPCLLDTGAYPNSQLSVFNRWGDEVYNSPRPYPNNWRGTFNGEDLPVDTYFYILDLGDGSRPITGYLLLQK